MQTISSHKKYTFYLIHALPLKVFLNGSLHSCHWDGIFSKGTKIYHLGTNMLIKAHCKLCPLGVNMVHLCSSDSDFVPFSREFTVYVNVNPHGNLVYLLLRASNKTQRSDATNLTKHEKSSDQFFLKSTHCIKTCIHDFAPRSQSDESAVCIKWTAKGL